MTSRTVEILVLMLAGALGSAQSLAASPTAQCQTRAQAALQAFTHGKYDQVAAHFAPGIADRATADKLQSVWQHLETSYGSFRQLRNMEPRTVNGQSVLVAPVTFANGELDALVACDDDNRIAAFQFVPPSVLSSGSNGGQANADSAMSRLLSVTKAHERAPHQIVKAHVEPDGTRVTPLAVPSPLGRLPGALTVPAGKGPFPAVVLVQGSGSSDMDETIGPNKPFRDIADGLAKAGIASLRYDKRGFVYARQVSADAKLTVDDEVTDDALTALHLLAKQQAIDPTRVFVLGHSEGGMLAPRIGKRDPALAGIIMLAAPARPLLTVMQQQTRDQGARMGLPKASIEASEQALADEQALLDKADPQHPPQGEFGGAPQTWWLSLHDCDQVAAAKSLSMPMLFLQGGSDFQVSRTLDFDAWEKALAGKPNVTFHLFPGLSHLFTPAGKTLTTADYAAPAHVDPAVIDTIATWVKAQPAK